MTAADVLVLLVIVSVGTARLPTPLAGDQALNLLMGQLIAQGGSPYQDLWDLKHPGVFVFFATGGALFGFDELGAHLFELFWMLGLAVLCRVIAGRWLQAGVTPSLAPLLTVGLYYSVASPFHLTQTEALVGLPLLICLHSATAAVRSERRMRLWLVASGFAGGVAMVFKIPYGVLAAAFWLLALRESGLERGESLWRAFVRMAPWVGLGAALPILAVLAYLLEKGLVGIVAWTIFRHPAEVAALVTVEPRRLLYAARFWTTSFAPALGLAFVGMLAGLRTRMDLMTRGLCLWLALGTMLIALQVISWWEYHFLLLLVPTGLLASRGLATVHRALASRLPPARRRWARAGAAMALVLAFAPQLGSATREVADVWRSRPIPFSRSGIVSYHADHYPFEATIRRRTAFLHGTGSHPGPIYVIDSPTYYVRAGRPPAIPWLAPWFHPTDRLWNHLVAGLKEARAIYVRVSPAALQAITDYRPSLGAEVGAIVPLVESRYEVLSSDDDGTWYVRRDKAARR